MPSLAIYAGIADNFNHISHTCNKSKQFRFKYDFERV